MSFATALSGLNAASNELSVTGNNIANANTVGFKMSRAEFADVYSASLAGVSNITPGSGVKVANDAQQFNQGVQQNTNNNLDMAINGEGFFTLAKSPTEVTDLSYSRDGEFALDQTGYLVNNDGKALMAYKPNGTTVAAGFSTGVLQPVQINTLTGSPAATATVNLAVNLNANNTVPSVPTFDPTNVNSYNSQTSETIYDSLGTGHILSSYFVKTGANAWNVYHFVSETATPTVLQPLDANAYGTNSTEAGAVGTIPTPQALTFTSSGKLLTPASGKFTLATYTLNPATGAAPISISNMNYFGSTQVQQSFSVNTQTQDGLPAGQLTGISIDSTGVIFANFSNGGSQTLGQVALSRFANTNGLAKIGNTSWKQSANSGSAIAGQAGANNFGSIQSGALESSNVNLSSELVNLIISQQAYQANAKTISTQNTIMSSILQIA